MGAPEEELTARLGQPAASRRVGDGRWWRWRGSGWELRVRCEPGRSGEGSERAVASWTLRWSEGKGTVREAVAPLGLWPEAAPDASPSDLDLPLARRGIPLGDGEEGSLTVGVRGGRFVQVTCFDEAPDWR